MYNLFKYIPTIVKQASHIDDKTSIRMNEQEEPKLVHIHNTYATVEAQVKRYESLV